MDPAQASGSSDPATRERSLSPRTLWLAAAGLVVVVSIALAWTQALRSDPYASPPISDPAWWLSPIERNAFRRLPVIVTDLNDVFVVPGTEITWAVGSGGMIAHSRDGGRNWAKAGDFAWTSPAPGRIVARAACDASRSCGRCGGAAESD
jgi:hypothetical protein